MEICSAAARTDFAASKVRADRHASFTVRVLYPQKIGIFDASLVLRAQILDEQFTDMNF